MHMADALISPAVGGTLWAATAGAIAYCSKKVRQELDDRKVPLMGVLAAFIFAAQMINFTIPATGSSGHLGGGLILTILLGPYAAFLAIASVLVVQALFFADGGLLALGCNIFNLGVFPCFVAYPFIFKPIAGDQPTQLRLTVAAILAAVIGLQLGAFAVVLEGIPASLAAEISAELTIPTIGIGAGPSCDGQVLVIHDILGLCEKYSPKFVKRYADLGPIISAAVTQYVAEVRNGEFPTDEHSFS